MTVLLLLLFLGGISFFIPQKRIKIYFVFSAIAISLMFLFYEPSPLDDLHRYYDLFDTVKHLSLSEYIDGNYGTQDWLINHMLNDYRQNSFLFMHIMFVISRTGIKELMPVFFSLITYIPLFMLVYDVCKDNKYSKTTMCFCFILILAGIDFRFASCLRNLSSYSIFAYTLYLDTVKKTKWYWCIIGYVAACGIHMACLPLIMLRLVAIIISGRLKWPVAACLLFTRRLALLFASLANTFLGGNSFISSFANKIENYFLGRTEYNNNGAIFFCAAILVLVIIYIAVKKDRSIPKEYKKYDAVYLYSAALTIGCIGQYDILLRNCQLLVMLSIPFVSHFINSRLIFAVDDIKFVSPQRKLCRDMLVCCCFVGLVLASFLFYTLFSYIPIDKCFGN